MTTVAIVVRQGADEREIDAVTGESLMHALKGARISGIEAVCSGSMVCGTCHAYVTPGPSGELPPIGEGEAEMLDEAVDRRPESRLTCQIDVTPVLAGIIVEIPASQM
ncbi:2Fe-2S iron-sulfur cluster-binding protein [Sphingosinithalassobacter portus]|uniref:2Fe-2S iron-sulfur cluster-binding protein n=1 Tax=Stakelama portus TaxID=2676234 RepID=UPI001961425A|nr:2Fe-2S iron-sulfur cluster-binding protein [Sphingosinithalassobacter portus]